MKIVIKVQELTTYIAMRSILAALLLFQSASVRISNSPAKKKKGPYRPGKAHCRCNTYLPRPPAQNIVRLK